MNRIELGKITVDVIKKDIKNIHLSVYPPNGRVRISAPTRMNLDTIRIFAISKLSWIKKQQRQLQNQERETVREYLDRESHFVWGKRCLLKVVEKETTPQVTWRHKDLQLSVRPKTTPTKKQEILESWFRDQLKAAVPPLIEKWQPIIGVKVKKFFVQRMKTRWGSCNPATKSIRLNTELAKKPAECLEYIVVHELVHLVERTHNERFVKLLDKFLPKWRFLRAELNRLPVRHEEWGY